MSPKKKSKLEDSTAVDRISDFPDEILCHVLSFLPTKLAFTTTVLSKRWTLLFYSLDVLRFRFNDETVKNHNSFNHLCRFIDTLMLSPRVSNQPIKTFSLKYRFHRCKFNSPSKSNVSAWVEAAAPKLQHVEKFVLILHYSITLNPSILISRTLVILKLKRLKIKYNNLCVDLPSLKTLHLQFVSFKNKNDFIKLLNACPVLQDLHTFWNYYDEKKEEAKEFKSLSLSKLVRATIRSKHVPFTAICNVEFLSIYMGQGATFKCIPLFQNLIHIELSNFSCGWDGIVELLLNCPKLQILLIVKGFELSLSKDLEFPISAIECVSSHLRSCTIVNFNGSDIPFATYILQNARLLEVMKINVSASSSDGMQNHEIIKKLSTCPRMSSRCKLSHYSLFSN